MQALLFLILLALFTPSSSVQCARKAPYIVTIPLTILAIKDAAREALTTYAHLVAYMMENLAVLPASEVDAEMEHFMSIFCPQEYFLGYIGMNDPTFRTNRSQVSDLYKATALGGVISYPFNIDVYNMVVTDISSDSNHLVARANVTAFNRLFTPLLVGPSTYKNALFFGHYTIQVRISAQGDVCISRTTDITLDAYFLDSTALFQNRWNSRL